MRALIVTPPGLATVVEVDPPTVTAGHVVVDVQFAAVDAGDRAVAQGVYHELGYITRPTVGLGWDLVGVVRESAPGTGFAPGDRVVGVIDTFDKQIGTIAERVSVPFEGLTPLPDALPAEQAAVIPVGALTADQALALLGDERGTLLVTGAAGAVGGFALSIARERGYEVTGLARASDREFVESSGASFVTEITATYDAVLDPAILGEAAMAAVRDGGRYVGFVPGAEPAAQRQVNVSAVTVHADQQRLAALISLAARGGMPARVAGVIDLDEAPSAVATGVVAGGRGRLVVRL